MAVVVLIGLMSTIVVANMDGLTNSSSVSASARDLGAKLLFLHDQAAVQGRELVLEIEVEKQRWREIDAPSPTDIPDPDEREDKTFYGDWVELRRGVILEGIEFSRRDVQRHGVIRVSFDADGQLSPAGFTAFFRHEDDPENEGITVEVTGLTGLVDFHRGRWASEEVRDPDDF